jgi:hypothetical protein
MNDEVKTHRVTMWLCDLCLDGKGGECHVPGCALYLNRAPDLPLRNSLTVEIEGYDWAACPTCFPSGVGHVGDGKRDCATCDGLGLVRVPLDGGASPKHADHTLAQASDACAECGHPAAAHVWNAAGCPRCAANGCTCQMRDTSPT